jgi:hypothetical protein
MVIAWIPIQIVMHQLYEHVFACFGLPQPDPERSQGSYEEGSLGLTARHALDDGRARTGRSAFDVEPTL